MAVRKGVDYPWYQVVGGPEFTQGDILRDCPVPVPAPDEAFLKAAREGEQPETQIGVKTATLIVLTQACDIENNKVESIVLCPVWPLEYVAEKYPQLATPGGKEKVRKGHFHYFHLLNKDDDLAFGHLVVDFRELYSLPTDFLRLVAERCGERPRLLPPYREHLSQSFARYFMRVGLPVDIPHFQ
jgi:hypothetical protein